MLNHAERLLSTVQNLRRFVNAHPDARGDVAVVERDWLPTELFPPERELLLQALNVLINAGELFVADSEPAMYYARSPLERAAGY